jgi:hypothetical protein
MCQTDKLKQLVLYYNLSRDCFYLCLPSSLIRWLFVTFFEVLHGVMLRTSSQTSSMHDVIIVRRTLAYINEMRQRGARGLLNIH